MMKRHAIVLSVCLTAALAVSCSNSETKKKRFFDQAEQAFAKKQYPEAILGYRNAIKIDPRFGDARYKLAPGLRRRRRRAQFSARSTCGPPSCCRTTWTRI